MRRNYLRAVPAARYGTPDEIAGPVSFLARTMHPTSPATSCRSMEDSWRPASWRYERELAARPATKCSKLSDTGEGGEQHATKRIHQVRCCGCALAPAIIVAGRAQRGGVQLQVRPEPSRHASALPARGGSSGEDQGGHEGTRRDSGLSEFSTRVRYRFAEPGARGGIELFTLSGLILSTLVAPASISGIGFAFPDYDKVWAAIDGDLGAYHSRADQEGRTHGHGQDLGQRLSPDHELDQADQLPGRLEGLQDPRTARARCGHRCTRPSARPPPASISTKSIPRCRPRWWKARRTRSRSFLPRSSTRCRSTVR